MKAETETEITEYKHFDIVHGILKPGRKTREYRIISKSQGMCLGMIKWHGAWRQYCFFPEPFTEAVWSEDCLDDIRHFILKGRSDVNRNR